MKSGPEVVGVSQSSFQVYAAKPGLVLVLETGSHYLAQAGLTLTETLLNRPPQCWDYVVLAIPSMPVLLQDMAQTRVFLCLWSWQFSRQELFFFFFSFCIGIELRILCLPGRHL